MIKDFIKKIPFIGWFVRFIYNILRINNLKHMQFMQQQHIHSMEEQFQIQSQHFKEQSQHFKEELQIQSQHFKEELQIQSDISRKLQNALFAQEKRLKEFQVELNSSIKEQIAKELVYLQASVHQRIDQFIFDTKIDLDGKTKEYKKDIVKTISENSKLFFDDYYLAFEERFRGSRRDILKRYENYLKFIDIDDIQKALDIGSGRGEWVELLAKRGVDIVGVDMNSAMSQLASSYDLEIINQDIFRYLSAIKDESYDLITGFHIIEHMPYEALLLLMGEVRRVLKKGGKLIFETPNPKNLLVASLTFYNDPTHLNPLPPDVVKFMVEYIGFRETRIVELNPFGKDICIKEQSASADMLNSLLFSEQDYIVIGKK